MTLVFCLLFLVAGFFRVSWKCLRCHRPICLSNCAAQKLSDLLSSRESLPYISPYVLVPLALWLFSALSIYIALGIMLALLVSLAYMYGARLKYSDRNPVLMGILLGSHLVCFFLYFLRILPCTYGVMSHLFSRHQ